MTKELSMNECFKELWNCEDRYMLLYGSRSSGKSQFIATKIIVNMMTHSYYSLIAVRLTYESIQESSYKTLCETIKDMGLETEFTITKSPMKIVYKQNGNQVIFRGLDDTSKLKSILNPSAIWYEEDIIPTLDEYLTISLSLRGSKSKYLQEIFTFNPVIDDYENHWFYKRFFEGQEDASFRTCIEQEIDGQVYKQWATVHHSTWRDNAFLSPQDRLVFKSLENDPVAYQQQSLGRFCNRIVKDQFYKGFKMDKNARDSGYNRNFPLHCSFDFNVTPYITCTIFQGFGKELYQIDEICLSNPDNNTIALCREIRRRYSSHEGGMFIYGDANGYRRDTRMEKGENDYSIIFKELSRFHPSDRTERSNPSVKTRGDFINSLFKGEIADCSIWFNPNCKNSINDLLGGKEAPDGSKLKEKVRDKVTGMSYEKYHHCSDSFDYVIVKYFEKEYSNFKTPGRSRYMSGKLPMNRRNKSANY